MDQEPYPNQEDECIKAWMALDTNWLTSLVEKLKEIYGECLEWVEMQQRWKVELVLWYGRWLEEMKEKDSQVCYQIRVEEVECSKQLCFYFAIQE